MNINIYLSNGKDDDSDLSLNGNADQRNPKKYYVYAHCELDGNIFYIGKGKGRRAWERFRHYFWEYYVNNRLRGKYKIMIIADNLSEEDALELEERWIMKEGDKLVNWINPNRDLQFELLNKIHVLKEYNKEICRAAYELESENADLSIKYYIEALKNIDEYAFIKYERGLIGELMDEINSTRGFVGEVKIINRLTIMLLKLDECETAKIIADQYFDKYRFDKTTSIGKAIIKRVSKFQARPNQSRKRGV